MRLTHLADYAVVMMTAAARREPCSLLSTAELASETGVPLPTAQKLMGKLAAAGLLTSVRGIGGGFTIVTAADIAIAAEDATFGLSEINFGHFPGGEGVVLGPAVQGVPAHAEAGDRQRMLVFSGD